MRCLDVQSHLEQYVDGALDPVQAEKLEAHLTTCSVCST